MYDLCNTHMHAYVLVETVEGHQIDGIITGVDEDQVYLAVPDGGMSSHGEDMSREDRQFGFGGGYGGFYPGYGYPGYGPGYGYYPGYPRRPFRRLILPLAALTALSVLPWY